MERSYLVTCEHASNAVPDDVALGVDLEILDSHVAWDPGAAPAAVALAQALGTEAVLGDWSRLVADLNRPETSVAVVPTVAFGVDVPGNRTVDRAARLARYHRPYWDRVRVAVDRMIGTGSCVHLSIHSFDGRYTAVTAAGATRDFDVGVLYDPAFPHEVALAAGIERELMARGLTVRHNQPYAGVDEGLIQTLRHAYAHAPYVGLELESNQQRLAHRDLADPRFIDGLRAALSA